MVDLRNYKELSLSILRIKLGSNALSQLYIYNIYIYTYVYMDNDE